jgi:hypothetical protein
MASISDPIFELSITKDVGKKKQFRKTLTACFNQGKQIWGYGANNGSIDIVIQTVSDELKNHRQGW